MEEKKVKASAWKLICSQLYTEVEFLWYSLFGIFMEFIFTVSDLTYGTSFGGFQTDAPQTNNNSTDPSWQGLVVASLRLMKTTMLV